VLGCFLLYSTIFSMKNMAGALTWLLVLLSVQNCTSASTKANVTPVHKVIEMLSGMLAKAKSSMHEEELEWTAFKQWCGDAEASKQEAVKAANVKIEVLEASIAQHDADAERLNQTIEELEADIVSYKSDIESAIAERSTQASTYKAKSVDYGETLGAITQAIAVLKKQAYDRPQVAALLQAVKSRVPQPAHRVIDNFLSLGSESADLQFVNPPEANAYEFQSDHVIDMLEGLKDKFTDERTALEKAEMTAIHAHQTHVQDLQSMISAAERAISRDTGYKAKHQTSSAEENGELKDAKTTRTDDKSFLEELHSTCNLKSSNFEKRQKLRAEEIEALDKAITIISGSAVAGAAETYLPTMLLQRSASVLVQLRSYPDSAHKQRALDYLRVAAQKLQSHTLSAIAFRFQEIEGSAGPFDKVIKMIQDLIAKLQAAQSEEAQHKSWCDGELSANENTRTTKTTEVNTLTSEIDGLKSEIAVLKKSISALAKGIAETKAKFAEATEMRNKESNENDKTIIDATEGLTAITDAITILTDFYTKAKDATALVQDKARGLQEPPPIFSDPYKGLQTEGSNVLSFLDVIKSDFMRLKDETTSQEAEARDAYKELETTTNTNVQTKEQEKGDEEGRLQDKEGKLVLTENDLSMAQSQLTVALEYYDKLKSSCIAVSTSGSSAERVQRREEEIASLKEALAILNGEFDAGVDGMYSSVNGGNRGYGISR